MTAEPLQVPVYRPFPVRVSRVQRLSPSFLRVTFTGADLADFGSNGRDRRIKVMLPLPDRGMEDCPSEADRYGAWRALPAEQRMPIRTCTVRAGAAGTRRGRRRLRAARGDRPGLGVGLAELADALSPTATVELDDVDVDAGILWEVPLEDTLRRRSSGVYAWLAGEAGVMEGLRRHLVQERGVDRRSVAFMGYWRDGKSSD